MKQQLVPEGNNKIITFPHQEALHLAGYICRPNCLIERDQLIV